MEYLQASLLTPWKVVVQGFHTKKKQDVGALAAKLKPEQVEPRFFSFESFQTHSQNAEFIRPLNWVKSAY